jgi:hypothetical protein
MKMGFPAGSGRCGKSAAFLALLLMAGCGEDRQKEADAIAKGIEGYLALMEDPAQPVRLHHDKVAVMPNEDGKSFSVAITGLRYGMDATPGATIGEIDYRLTPEDSNTYRVDDLKAPTEFPLLGAGGKALMTFKMETTAFSALWSSPLRNFLKLDWAARNLAIREANADADSVSAGAMEMKADGKESGNGRIDETTVMAVDNIAGANPETGAKFTLSHLTGTFGVEGLDGQAYMQQITKLRDVFRKMAATAESAQAAAGPDPATAPAAQPLTSEDSKALAEALRALPKVVSSYHYDLDALGWVVTAPDGSPQVQVEKAGMGFAIKGIDTDKAEIDFGIHHDGLGLAGPIFQDPAAKALLPKSSSISLAATDLPVPALVEAVAGAIPDLTSPDPNTAAGGKMEIAGALMSALAKSDIKLSIEPSKLDTEIAHLAADGDLKLALQSPLKAVGAVNLALVGLDDIIALANSEAQDHPQAAGAIGMLQMVQSYAKRETGADGKPVDKFKIDLGASGAITINDKPLNGL